MVWPPPRLMPDCSEVTCDSNRVGRFFFHNKTPIYIDGSGMFGKVIEVRSAASAAVQIRDDSTEEWDAVSWPVLELVDQTSVVSEILALLITLRHLQPVSYTVL